MRLITDSSSDISRRSLRAAADSRTAPFSVLMTTYAGERAEFLEAALLSIIDQTLVAAQIVLVVDGPIDAAQHAVLDRGAEQATAAGSQFIQVDRAQCGGLAIALNHGLRHCSEPWIARMDSDDHAPPHRLAMQWEFLAAHPDIDVLAGYQMEFSAHPAQVDRVKTIPERHDDIARVLRWRNPISIRRGHALRRGPPGRRISRDRLARGLRPDAPHAGRGRALPWPATPHGSRPGRRRPASAAWRRPVAIEELRFRLSLFRPAARSPTWPCRRRATRRSGSARHRSSARPTAWSAGRVRPAIVVPPPTRSWHDDRFRGA